MESWDDEWRKKFITQRQGKEFILYPGLLDEAHNQGLCGMKTTLIQIPTEENNRVCIVHATATFKDDDGALITFDGIGDCAPNNVSPAIALHAIRMAETRAKARALRDGTNIGMTSLEELSEDDKEDKQDNRSQTNTRSNTTANTRQANTTQSTNKTERAAAAQAKATQSTTTKEDTVVQPARGNTQAPQLGNSIITKAQHERVLRVQAKKGVEIGCSLEMTFGEYNFLMKQLVEMPDANTPV